MTAIEANYDGLIGPTHNYAGLSTGNLASTRHGGLVSNPKAAALQGLAKMRRLAELGLVQGVLPPQDRPAIGRLRQLGFRGRDAEVLEHAWATAPALVARVSSASSMWAANAATVSPSADTGDGRVHLTPANLLTMPHRAIEAAETAAALVAALPDSSRFAIHAPLPAHADFADEGAANHLRLAAAHGDPGVEIFVYGRSATEPATSRAFPARQTLEACQAAARRAGLDPRRTVYLRQSTAAIDAGAFHNDVVAVAHERTLLFHEAAFSEKEAALEAIRRAADGLFEPELVEVTATELSLEDAVRSYLFNSQLVRPRAAAGLLLYAPLEVAETPAARACAERLVASAGPIAGVEHVDLRQSMQNGGGPACLRLRLVLNDAERAAARASMLLDDALHAQLVSWIERHYRDRLAPSELGDPALLRESRTALDELTRLLGLGNDHYAFQRG
jgi:succinylarginine dihydrolase